MTTLLNETKSILITCDYVGCDKDAEHISEYEEDYPDFETMSRNARADGWKIFKVNGTWHHLCPSHANTSPKL